ncbi:MAG: glycosyltransferase family 2 protein [Acidobacteriota bacterium]
MKISVVIPARNAAEHLDHLFRALLPQLLPGDECFLVDDASTDDTGQVAKRHGIQVLALEIRGGPAAARNMGVRHASGELVVFLDADVVPHEGLLQQMRIQMREAPYLAALIGSYDANPYAQSTVSRFRNLLHCYTHHNGSQDASTFWAGCGAILRVEFQQAGGFDALQFPEPSIEDIELGVRLKRNGKRIRLDPSLQVQHRKAWSLANMLRTDVMQRAIPWTRLILGAGDMPLDLNLKASQRISGVATAGALLLVILVPLAPIYASLGAAALLGIVITLNAKFYKFLASCGGWWFALRSIPLHLLYFLSSVLGYAIACGQFYLRRRA